MVPSALPHKRGRAELHRETALVGGRDLLNEHALGANGAEVEDDLDLSGFVQVGPVFDFETHVLTHPDANAPGGHGDQVSNAPGDIEDGLGDGPRKMNKLNPGRHDHASLVDDKLPREIPAGQFGLLHECSVLITRDGQENRLHEIVSDLGIDEVLVDLQELLVSETGGRIYGLYPVSREGDRSGEKPPSVDRGESRLDYDAVKDPLHGANAGHSVIVLRAGQLAANVRRIDREGENEPAPGDLPSEMLGVRKYDRLVSPRKLCGLSHSESIVGEVLAHHGFKQRLSA